MGSAGGGVSGPGTVWAGSLWLTPHPGSVRSTMNVVHVFFLKILGIQLWGQEQGVGAPVQSYGARSHSPRALPRDPGGRDPSAFLPQTEESRTHSTVPFLSVPRSQGPSKPLLRQTPKIWFSGALFSGSHETRLPAPCSLQSRDSAAVPAPSPDPPYCRSHRNLSSTPHSFHQPRFQIRP